MIPEELRLAMDEWERSGKVPDLYAFASAWEAQVDKIANGIAVLGEENASLRKRLEAAEEMRHTAEVAAGVYKNSDASLRKRLEAAERVLGIYNRASEIAQQSGSLFALVSADFEYAALAGRSETMTTDAQIKHRALFDEYEAWWIATNDSHKMDFTTWLEARIEALEHDLGWMRTDRDAAEYHIEELEKQTRLMAGTLSTFGRYSTMHPVEVLAEFAALAGEEKP